MSEALVSETLMQPAIQGFPLSPQQRRLWALRGEGDGPWRAVASVLLEGGLDPRRLREALGEVVERHEILRTAFRCLPGMTVPLQVVGEGGLSWEEAGDVADPERWEADAMARLGGTWGLAEEPPLRAALARTGPDRHLLVLALPALCADRRSLDNLIGEIGRSYGRGGAEEPMQYADFAAWQNEVLDSEETAEEREHWKRLGLESLLDAPLPFERDERGCFEPRLAAEVAAGCGIPGIAPEAFLLACWQLLIGRLSGRPELAVSARSDGRGFEELETALGPFDKLLPMAWGFEEGERFTQVARRAGRSLEQARAHQNAFAWERMAEWSGASEAGLAPVLAFEMDGPAAAVAASGLRLSLRRAEACTERFALKLTGAVTQAGELRACLWYDAGRFAASDVERLGGWFSTLAHAAAAAPESPVGDLELLPDAERREELDGRNRTRVDFPRRCLHELVAEQAARTPGRVAVRFEGRTLTFAELVEIAGRLARHLRALGVGPEVPVAIHAERSPGMVVALLGILQAGGAYVPLDPDHPAERLAAILDDVAPLAVVTQRHLAGGLPPHSGRTVLLEDVEEVEAAAGELSAVPTADDASLAYVIYTSGSTGRPKGVMVSHRAIVNRLLWMQRELPLEEGDRVLQKTPYGFDASIWEIFSPLLAGAELVLARPGGHQDSAYLARTTGEEGISVLQLVPSLLRPFLDEPEVEGCKALRRMFCGGEELPAELARRFAGRLGRAALHNLYGPTEAAIDATFWRCDGLAERRGVPIGHPIANDRVYLLSSRGLPVPAGVAGELCIGGVGLARGYWGKPDQTAERFVPDSFAGEPGARMYRTGDLARRRSGGEIEYLGRIDRQVKIRGVRIEPREIEAALAGHPGIQQAVVVAVPEPEGEGIRLVACVVPREEGAAPAPELRQRLAERLPAFMMPAALVTLRSLPLTPNGKLDVRALAETALLEAAQIGRETYAGPRTPTEEVLADVWADVLDIGRPSIHDNFFDLGGHSLRATQLISRVRRIFRVELPLRDLFERPTVAAFAAHIDSALRGGEAAAPPIVPVPRDERQPWLPLSFAQQRLWFLDQIQPGSSFYNLPTAVRFAGALDLAILERALAEIVRRHEALRTTFHQGEEGEPVQAVEPARPLVLPVADLSGLPEPLAEEESRRRVAAEVGRPFDLERGPLFRALLLRLDADDHVGVLTMHHITSDGWSTAVLIREVAALYEAFAQGRPSPLPELPVQYADFASWQRGWLSGEVLEAQIAWWRERLAGAPPVLELPTDRPRPEVQTFRGASEVRAMAAGLSPALHALARRRGVTLFMALVAAGAVLLRWWTGQEDVVVGTDVANRNRDETEGLIGFFINQLALRTRLSGDPSFAEVLDQVREVTLGAYAHEDLPFDQLVLALNPERSRKHSPLFQVKINLHNIPTPELELSGITLRGVRLERDTAQFDLILNVLDNPDAFLASVDYSTDLFDGRTIARVLGDYEALLAAVAERPEARLSELFEVLARTDREQRLAGQQERKQARGQTLKRVRREALNVAVGGPDADA